MDPLTHGVLGGIAGVAAWRLNRRRRTAGSCVTSKRKALGIGVLAGLFPDIDIVTFFFNPLYYDAYWHGTYTHSLILAPFWAGVLTLTFVWLGRRLFHHSCAWGLIFLICLLAIGTHIAADVITAWDIGVLMPIIDERVSFGVLFIIDPVFTLLTILLLVALARPWARIFVLVCLCLPLSWIALASSYKYQALQLAERTLHEITEAPSRGALAAWPQPFSLSHWKLVYSDESGSWSANVRISERPPLRWPLRWMARSAEGYALKVPGETSLPWRFHPQHPTPASKEAWERPEFQAVRDFMTYPVFLRQDNQGCVWFTDWLFVVPALEPPFQYAACQSSEDHWHVKRGQVSLPWEEPSPEPG
ncbi:metal-dependent hydrolase [Aliidiomarina sp. Khilg15.8]